MGCAYVRLRLFRAGDLTESEHFPRPGRLGAEKLGPEIETPADSNASTGADELFLWPVSCELSELDRLARIVGLGQ